MKQIILFGAGGHAAVILDILKAQIANGEEIEIKGLLDDSDKLEFMGYKVLGSTMKANFYHDENTEFIIAIGSNKIRQKLAKKYKQLAFYTAIHPSAIIGSNVKIQEGTVVMPRVVINANSIIGRHVIVNTGAIVEHDNRIEDYVHLSPNATLCGTVKVKKLTHIGANATVIQGITIGEQVIVGAGSTVIQDIPNQVTVIGSPAKTREKVREEIAHEGTYLLSVTSYE
ncbi:MAG: acetyltransferase [Turicibacter sp.]|nr:acetyltransferase [Turicibacter sp.]